MTTTSALDLLRGRMQERGWKKNGGGQSFTTPISEAALGWVGLTCATRGLSKGQVQVHVVVGVHFPRVEKCHVEAREVKKSSAKPATLSQPLYVLMPGGYRDWLFSEETQDSAADDVINALDVYGWPFMVEMADLATAVSLELSGTRIFRFHAWPFALAVHGKKPRALAILDRELSAARQDPRLSGQHVGYLERAREIVQGL